MRCCKTKGNIIIPPIVIMPQAPPIQRQVIPSPCPSKEIPYYIPVNNCYGPRHPRRLYRPMSPGQYPLYPPPPPPRSTLNRPLPPRPPLNRPLSPPPPPPRPLNRPLPPPRPPLNRLPPPGPDYGDDFGDY